MADSLLVWDTLSIWETLKENEWIAQTRGSPLSQMSTTGRWSTLGGREKRVRRMRTSNEKAYLCQTYWWSINHDSWSIIYTYISQCRFTCACNCKLRVGFVSLQDLLEPILLLVSMAFRGTHRMRYVHTYIFVIGIDSDARASRSIDNTSLHAISCYARYVSP
jgi:hypothetical protein